MEQSSVQSVKIIDEDLQFQTKAFEDYLRNSDFECLLSMCIVGSQSGGKSTLLNRLLGEPIFKTMDVLHGYSQTTLGIDAVAYKNWFVMDFEGSDSGEREERDQLSVQYKLGLFALIISDVILLNVFSNEIGRASSNYKTILRVIFENYLKYYNSKTGSKKLWILLRDCASGTTGANFQDRVIRDLHSIWNSIKNFDQEFDQLFEIKIIALHYTNESLVESDIDCLREDLIFSQRHDQASIQDLPRLLNNLWSKIKTEEDLDSILGVKDMIDASKCRKIIHKCLLEHTQQRIELEQRATHEFLDLAQIKSAYKEEIEEEIRQITQNISSRVVEEEMDAISKTIEVTFKCIQELQEEFLSQQILKNVEKLEKRLKWGSDEVAFIPEFLNEARKSSAWKDSYHLDLFKNNVKTAFYEFMSRERSEIEEYICALEAESEEDLWIIESDGRKEIKERSEKSTNIAKNLNLGIDKNDSYFKIISQILEQKLSLLSLKIQNENLEREQSELKQNLRKQGAESKRAIESLRSEQKREIEILRVSLTNETRNAIKSLKSEQMNEIEASRSSLKNWTKSAIISLKTEQCNSIEYEKKSIFKKIEENIDPLTRNLSTLNSSVGQMKSFLEEKFGYRETQCLIQ